MDISIGVESHTSIKDFLADVYKKREQLYNRALQKGRGNPWREVRRNKNINMRRHRYYRCSELHKTLWGGDNLLKI